MSGRRSLDETPPSDMDVTSPRHPPRCRGFFMRPLPFTECAVPFISMFRPSDLSVFDCHERCGQYGFSYYKGVLILWDEDHDQRIVKWIESLPSPIRNQLLCAHEHEGTIGLAWRRNKIPQKYKEGNSVLVDGDCWTIIESHVPNAGKLTMLRADDSLAMTQFLS
jgi:hypothetical protein